MKRALLLASLLALAPSVVMGQTTPAGMTATEAKKAEVYFHFSMARLFDQEQDWEESIKAYRKALEIDPNNAEIYASMARTYLNQRNREEASKAAQKAVELNPNSLGAHKLLGDVYVAMVNQAIQKQLSPATLKENLDRAIQEFEAIVRIDPDEGPSYLMLGQLYRLSDNREKAAEIYRKYLGIEPSSEDGIIELASLSMEANQFAEAAALLKDFLNGQPTSDRAWAALAETYLALDPPDNAGAIDAYKRAIALNDSVELRASLAEALYAANRLEEARIAYEEVLKGDLNNLDVIQRLAQIYRRQMKYSQARDLLARGLRRNATNVLLRFDMALVDRDEGKFEDSARGFEQLVKDTEKASYNQQERRLRALLFTQVGIVRSLQTRYDEAVAAFNNVKFLSDADQRVRIDLMIADTYKDARDIDRAEQIINAALQGSPDERELLIARADILARRGRTDESIALLRKVAGGKEPDLDLVASIVGVYENASRFTEAQAVLDAAAKSFPEDKQVYFLQGALFERQDKVTEAERAFRKALELDEDNPSVLNYLGYMMADRGRNLEEALEMIQKAVDTDPINGAFLDSLGWVYFKLNRLDLAEQFLKRAVVFAATNATMHDHLGDLYYKTGRLPEAQASWTKGLQFADEPDEATRIRQKLKQ
jgi:tetratricopeptide (TPR) repeat protein